MDLKEVDPWINSVAGWCAVKWSLVVVRAQSRKFVQRYLKFETTPQERGGSATRHTVLFQHKYLFVGFGQRGSGGKSTHTRPYHYNVEIPHSDSPIDFPLNTIK